MSDCIKEKVTFIKIEDIYKKIKYYKKIIIVSGSGPEVSYCKKLYNSINQNLSTECFTINIPESEQSKTVKVLNMLWDLFSTFLCDKNTLIISIGGGSTSDVVGMASATFKRGIDYCSIPTTLLAMIDAAIGGKRGVNNKYGKNIMGCFYSSKEVFIDSTVLSTLDDINLLNGICEALKISLIAKNNLFELFTENTKDTLVISDKLLKECIEAKQDIVCEDYFDVRDKRIVLNYGHTLAHALEAYNKYQDIPHGLAVALGMDFIAKTFSDKNVYDAQNMLFANYKIDNQIKKIKNTLHTEDVTFIYDHLSRDKKIFNNKIKIVYLKNIGSPKIKSLSIDKIKSSLIEYINN